MKKLLLLTLSLFILFNAIPAFSSSADQASVEAEDWLEWNEEEAMYVVYVSNGSGTNATTEGMGTKDKPVQYISNAINLLKDALDATSYTQVEGIIRIIGSFQIASTNTYLYHTAKKIIFEGVTADDGTMAVFAQNRSGGINFQSDVVFRNLEFQIGTEKGTYSIYANGHTLEFAEDVVCKERSLSGSNSNSYPIVYAGTSGSVDLTGEVNVNLYGGTFHNVYVGNANTSRAFANTVNLSIGEKAIVKNYLWIGPAKSFKDVNITLNGVVEGKIALDDTKVVDDAIEGNVTLTVGANGTYTSFSGITYLGDKLNHGTATFAFATYSGYTAQLQEIENVNAILKENGQQVHILKKIVESDKPVAMGIQIRMDSEISTDYDLRFSATLDHINYQSVGFSITAKYGANETKSWDRKCKTVYQSLNTITESGTGAVAAWRYNGNYIYALSICNIPASYETVIFTVQPYAVGTDGQTVYLGDVKTVICTVSSVDGVTTVTATSGS